MTLMSLLMAHMWLKAYESLKGSTCESNLMILQMAPQVSLNGSICDLNLMILQIASNAT